jgi:hypothetical protein
VKIVLRILYSDDCNVILNSEFFKCPSHYGEELGQIHESQVGDGVRKESKIK